MHARRASSASPSTSMPSAAAIRRQDQSIRGRSSRPGRQSRRILRVEPERLLDAIFDVGAGREPRLQRAAQERATSDRRADAQRRRPDERTTRPASCRPSLSSSTRGFESDPKWWRSGPLEHAAHAVHLHAGVPVGPVVVGHSRAAVRGFRPACS